MAWLIMLMVILFVTIGMIAIHAEHGVKTTTSLVEIALLALGGLLLGLVAFANL